MLIAFAIYCIINGCNESLPYRYFIGGDMIYLAGVFLFQAIYHFYKPTPQMIAIIESATQEEEEDEADESEEEEKPSEAGPNE